MRITDSVGFTAKVVEQQHIDSTPTGIVSENIQPTSDQFVTATPNSIDAFMVPAELPAQPLIQPPKNNEVSIDVLADTINQALQQSQTQPLKTDFEVPNLKVPTESEKETMKQFEKGKEYFLNNWMYDRAVHPEEFHKYMRQMYGDNYDREAAEEIRKKIVAQDESWLPKMTFVPSKELRGDLPAQERGEFGGDTVQGYLRAVDSETLYIDSEYYSAPKEGDRPMHESVPAGDYGDMVWTALRSKLDPQDANNVEGRYFKQITVDGKPKVVEFLKEMEPYNWPSFHNIF